MENNINIEELFRSNLQNMEANPPVGGWEAIQAKMNLAGNAAATTATVAKTGLGFAKIAAIITVAVGTGLGVGYFAFKEDTKANKEQTKQNTEETTEQATLNTPVVIPANVELTEISSVNKNGKVVSIVQVKKGSETQKVLVEFEQNQTNKDHSIVGQWLSKDKNKYSQDLINKLVQQLESNNEETAIVEEKTNTVNNNEVKVQKLDDDDAIAGIKPSVWSGKAPLTVDFSNLTNAEEFEWNFGDNTTSKDNAPRHTYNEPGNYVVALTVKNKAGKVSNDRVLIMVEEKHIEAAVEASVMNIPKGNLFFTPNGDGAVDVFILKGENIESFQMTITDQKGKVIFESRDINTGWDGADAPVGTYFCIYKATGKDGVVHKDKLMFRLNR